MSAWNSTLTRKVPLKPKNPWRRGGKKSGEFKAPLRKTPLKKISKARRTAKAKYFGKHGDFLERNPVCMICLVRAIIPPNPSTEIHHKFGRANSLLNDERGFVASCRACREWPHEHPREARNMGVLGSASNWNIPIDKHRHAE